MAGLVLCQAGAVSTLWICSSRIWDRRTGEMTRASDGRIYLAPFSTVIPEQTVGEGPPFLSIILSTL